MNRTEAIAELKRHKNEFTHDHGWNTTTIKALDKAIEALEFQDKIKISEKCTSCEKLVLFMPLCRTRECRREEEK